MIGLRIMRTLLRHTKTGLYFQSQEKWTENPGQAYDFRFIDRARQYIALWGLEEVELTFAFEEQPAGSELPVHTVLGKAAA